MNERGRNPLNSVLIQYEGSILKILNTLMIMRIMRMLLAIYIKFDLRTEIKFEILGS